MSAGPQSKPNDPLHLPIYVRTYAEEVDTDAELKAAANDNKARKNKTPAKQRPKIRNPARFTLVFDTETTTDPTQRFKIGWARLYDGKVLDHEWLIADPAVLTAGEVCTIHDYVAERGLEPPISLEQFRDDVLLGTAFAIGATIVTFNGPFDFARVALDWKPARANSWNRKMQGGISLTLSSSPYQPSIQIKHLNSWSSIIEFTAPRRQETTRSLRKKTDITPTHRGWFIDVKSIARALLSRVHSLESLTETLGTPTQKRRSHEHGQTLTPEYIDYARTDVLATWECYGVLAAKYGGYGLDAELHQIISEASVGKAALDTMGIRQWTKVQPGGPDNGLTSTILSTYFGGRTEVHIRRELVRVVLTDFTSMYPSVCTLQNLWAFVIGEGFTHHDATEEIRAFVDAATPEQFQDQSAWPKLSALVWVRPDEDLLPVRADYAMGYGANRISRKPEPAHATIGLNYLSYDGLLCFTLADCLMAKFLTGKSPAIERAIRFIPGQPQSGLQPIKLLGRHAIDPYKQDFYRELIRARQAEEASKDGKSAAEQTKIEEVREALKITANSTSYGIFVQVNVNAAPKGVFARVYRSDGSFFTKRVKKVETPGPWFNPIMATLITGSARLMLALAEYQVLKAGLGWAFCDTDSMAIAMPGGMDEQAFLARVDQVVEWFRPLNPYGLPDSLLKVEKVNFASDGPKQPLPLYCWAISSKRYALFNIDPEGQAVIRKASAHGLGYLVEPYTAADGPTGFPAPLKSVLGGKEKLQLWHYHVWCAILRAVLAGTPDDVRFDYHPRLLTPTASRYSATNPEYMGWFRTWSGNRPYADAFKPFNFLYALHLSKFARNPDEAIDCLDSDDDAGEIHPVAPFDRDLRAAIEKAFDRVTDRPVDSAILETYGEVLVGYPNRSEAKFLNALPFDRGMTERRHIVAAAVELIGKEADRWEEEYYLGSRGGEQVVSYGGDPAAGGKAFFQLQAAIAAFGKSAVAAATGVSRQTLAKIERGERAVTSVPHWHVLAALERLRSRRTLTQRADDAELARLRAIVHGAGGIRAAARRLAMDPSNLSKRLRRGADRSSGVNH